MSDAFESSSAEVLVVDYIAKALCEAGIDTFFVLTGGAIAPLIDAISRRSDTKIYCVQHEQGASMAVDGYYRVTGRPACALVTSGPGAQNLFNGVCGSFFDSIPGLYISGQVNTSESLYAISAKPRQVGFQEMRVVKSFRPFTNYVSRVSTPAELVPALSEAVRLMMHGRKAPSLIDLPVNVQMSYIDNGAPLMLKASPPFSHNGSVPPTAADLLAIAQVADMLIKAERPVFLLGDGSRSSRAELTELLRVLQVPFVRSWGGLDVVPTTLYDDNNGAARLDLGPIGVYGDRVANFVIQNADLLVVLGARLDTRQTGGNLKSFSTRSRKIMVDIDAAEIDKLGQRGMPIEVGLVMDVHDFVLQLSSLPSMAKPLAVPEWLDKIGQWYTKYGVEQRSVFENYVSPYELLTKLNTLLPSDAFVAVETGATIVWAFQSLRPRSPDQRIFASLGNNSMGYAFPAAIGAAVAAPHRPVFCIVGDGGFQMNIQELATAKHYNLNIKVFVLNNSGYGIIRQFQNTYLGGRHVGASSEYLYGTEQGEQGLDFVAIARAYGVMGQRISSLDQLLPELVTARGLAVYDVDVHQLHGMQPKTEFGNSLENMWPFLDSATDMVVTPPPQIQVKGWVRA